MTWRDADVSASGTHHVRGGVPLYAERFDRVLKFQEPGLAPVRRGSQAWHIRADGTAAYDRRFRRAFGFYEGLAAAEAADGWRHIRPDGADLYDARYGWCGNFQGGRCAVRRFDGLYLHIAPGGEPAYEARWRYAGDFREGAAVAQSDDGRSTHIDLCGEPVHGARFLDLDVFHKGRARARDEDGWTHIDRAGRCLYARRFAAVEPFYNGQARVERFDGGLEAVDETGAPVLELRPARGDEFMALSGDLTGFWRTQTIRSAVELGVFEALPGAAEDIARTCALVPARARRLLRSLAELRLAADEGGVWRATERGSFLTAGHPCTLADAAIEYGRHLSEKWEALPRALRLGSGWRAADAFAEVAEDPTRVAPHHRMLAGYALHDYGAVPAALGLRGDERVIDAGGGLGVLAGLLVETYPELHVTVLDRPEVVRQAARERREDRVTFRSADLFEPWDVAAEAVVLARVLHDWDDGPALRLLRRARRALPRGGRLFAIETPLTEDGASGGLCDLHLLAVTEGKERTVSDYATLMNDAGFVFDGVRSLPTVPSVLAGTAR